MAPPPPAPLIQGSSAPRAKVVAMTASTQSPPSASTAAPISAARRDCAATMPPFDVVAGLRICWALENWSRMGLPCRLVVFHVIDRTLICTTAKSKPARTLIGLYRQEWHSAESDGAGGEQDGRCKAKQGWRGRRADAERARKPQRNDAGFARWPCRRDCRDDGRRRDPRAGSDRRGARLLLGPEPQGVRGAGPEHRQRRDAALLAGLQSVARVPRAGR